MFLFSLRPGAHGRSLRPMNLTPNESPVDRGVRGLVSVLAAVLAFTVTRPSRPAGLGLLAVSGIMGLTAVVGVCPVYRVLGVGTRR